MLVAAVRRRLEGLTRLLAADAIVSQEKGTVATVEVRSRIAQDLGSCVIALHDHPGAIQSENGSILDRVD